jgi:hypothetical protein
MGVEITTKLVPGSQASDLRGLVDESGTSFRPLHPGTSDPELASYFIVHVSDPAQAPRVLDRLRRHAAVAAAYVKPPDAMP